jgi:glycine dehydrogenase subunit 1
MFSPHTTTDLDTMLAQIGIKNIEELFQDIPISHRFPDLKLPDPVTEMEIRDEMEQIAASNETVKDLISFLGAGAYHHYIPSAVDMLLRRGEFYTSYTPYQPEISQGTLRAIFDYQSLIASLTGMDVSNASHYDGATSTAEAVSLAIANFRGKRTKVVLSPSLHPEYRSVIHTYHQGTGINIVGEELPPFSPPEDLFSLIDTNTALVIVQYPDFFGRIYDLGNLAKHVHSIGAILAISTNPIALGLLKPPGEFGADIVTGEGQPLGIPLSFGGPYLGIFATKTEYVRKMAGRLVGETIDNRGQRAYVLTLTAREQHIRREKATSNICTNQGLMALAATIYLSVLGKHGLRKVANLCYQKAHYAASLISKIKGCKVWSDSLFFHEFVVELPFPSKEIHERLLEHDIIAGYDLHRDFSSLDHHILLAVTEMNKKEEIDYFAGVLQEVLNG